MINYYLKALDLNNFVRSFRTLQKYLRGLITGIDKALDNKLEQCGSKYVLHLLVYPFTT